MFTFAEVEIDALIVHRVGNKSQDEGYTLSKEELAVDEELHIVLQEYFLTPFKSEDIYHFIHHAGVAMNDVYQYCKTLFEDRTQFKAVSEHLLKHLYEKSSHLK